MGLVDGRLPITGTNSYTSIKIIVIIKPMAEYGEELSDRELDVLRCIARGDSNKEAAAELHISENTVKVHLRRVFAKLGVSSRTEATRVAIQQGLVIVPGVEVEALSDEGESVDLDDDTSHTVEAVSENSTLVEQTATVSPSVDETEGSSRRFTLWRTASIVLAVLLIVLVGAFVLLRLQENARVVELEPFTETELGEDWSMINRPLPEALTSMATASVGLNVYAIGGETADNIVNTIYSFNAGEHIWHALTPKPTAVADASAAELFGEIYVVGGRLDGGESTDAVEVYSPTQNAWRPVTSLPQPIAGGVALSDGSFLYLFGGRNGSTYLDTAYVYDPSEDNWRPLDKMVQVRAFATGQFMTGHFYVVGGFNGENELDSCEYFDPTESQWFACPPMLLPRGGSASAVVLNEMYVIGGGLDGRQDITYSEQYNPTTETWQVVNTPLLTDNPDWTGLGVANVENRIFVFGGRRAQNLTTDTYIYAPFVYRTFLPGIPLDGN